MQGVRGTPGTPPYLDPQRATQNGSVCHSTSIMPYLPHRLAFVFCEPAQIPEADVDILETRFRDHEQQAGFGTWRSYDNAYWKSTNRKPA